jgi:hypothetical protein
MSRDQIAMIHFHHTKNPAKHANDVLKKLVDRGFITQVIRHHQCFLYMPNPKSLPLESNKRTHDLALVDFYILLKKHGDVEVLGVEKKLDYVQPDIILRYNGKLNYVEVQLTQLRGERMNKKIEKYEKHVKEEGYKEFGQIPRLWIYSPDKYDLTSSILTIKQSKLG